MNQKKQARPSGKASCADRGKQGFLALVFALHPYAFRGECITHLLSDPRHAFHC